MQINEKALVVFSGGQDSTTCLFWAQKHFASVEAITFDYGQRHKAEIACAQAICQELNVKQTILDMNLLNQVAVSSLTRDMPIAEDQDQMPNSFVPGRNLLFLSFAAINAYSKGIRHLITGVCETDFSGYPDCRDDFVKSLNVTLNLGLATQFVLHTPLMWLNKAETWSLADDLGAFEYVRSKTLTCYNGIIGTGCMDCPACKLRSKGLQSYLAAKEGRGYGA